MKLKKGIPVGYFLTDKTLIIHTKEKFSDYTIGTLWRRTISESSYERCEICSEGESVEDAVLGKNSEQLYLKISRRDGPILLDSSLVVYSIPMNKLAFRFDESLFLSLRPNIKRAHIYRLFSGTASIQTVDCIVWLTGERKLRETWVVRVTTAGPEFKLLFPLESSFW